MIRPCKLRNIKFIPEVTYFKPRGVPMSQLQEVSLFHDEMEALRLKYVENLDQTMAAEKMGISQSTFARILYSANKKLAQGLINGMAIKIE